MSYNQFTNSGSTSTSSYNAASTPALSSSIYSQPKIPAPAQPQVGSWYLANPATSQPKPAPTSSPTSTDKWFLSGVGQNPSSTSTIQPTQPMASSSSYSRPPVSGSVVDYLNSQNKASDYNSRANLAAQYGISNYQGTADQNNSLLNALMSGQTAQASTGTTPGMLNTGTRPSTTSPALNSTSPAAPSPAYNINSNIFGELVTGLANKANQPIDSYNQIQAQIEDNLQKQANLKAEAAQANATIESQGIDKSLATGQQGIINNLYANKLGALATQGQGLAAQLSAANTQQGLQQSGLGQAGQLAQPQTGVAYGTQIYNPVTGKLQGAGSSFMAGQVAGEQNLGQQYAQNASAVRQSTAIRDSIVNFLNTTPINPSAIPDVNSAVAFLSGKTSDPAYQNLSAQLNEYINTLAPILGTGGDVTNLKLQMAEGMINGRMSPEAIVSQLNNIESLAQQKLQAQAQGSGTLGQSSGGNLFGSFF